MALSLKNTLPNTVKKEECLWRIISKNKESDLNFVNYELTKYNLGYDTKKRHGGYQIFSKTPKQKINETLIL